MLQRLIVALIGLLGLAAAGLGVASATVWKADDPLVASVTADTSTLRTEPGVLEVAGTPVTVTVTASDSPVVLAIGRETDVAAWIGSDPHDTVTGFADWHELAVSASVPESSPSPTPSASGESEVAEPSPSPSTAEGDLADQSAANPAGSDMWVVEATGNDTTSLTWTAPASGRWSLIAASLGDTTPTLELSWPQEVTTPWLWPGVAAGVVLLFIALVWWIRTRRQTAEAHWHEANTGALSTVVTGPATGSHAAVAAPRRKDSPAPSVTPVAPMGSVTGAATVAPVESVASPESQPVQPLTRRQIREAEAAAQASRRRRRRGSEPAAESSAADVATSTDSIAISDTRSPGAPPAFGGSTAMAEVAGSEAPHSAAAPETSRSTAAPETAGPGEVPEVVDRPASGPRRLWRRKRAESVSPSDGDRAVQETGAVSIAPVDDDLAPAVPGVDDPDDHLSGTQRADAWRQMWGFPLDGSGAEPQGNPSVTTAPTDAPDQPRTNPEGER